MGDGENESVLLSVFLGKRRAFFEGWAGWLCVVCLGVQMAEMNCWIGLPGREAGQA